MLGSITWDLDPILIHLGFLQIRYYGVCFALTIYTGFYIWRRQCLKNGETPEFADNFLWWGVIAVVGGARLGHVFFYEPHTFLAHPIEILKFWKGGLASHGATVALILVLWLFGKKYHRSWFRLGDYLAPAIAIAAGGVRIGNFFNSEIVGRVTNSDFGVRFLRYCQIEGIAVDQCVPRHPSQLYEFLMGVVTYLVVMAVEKRDIRRSGSGLMAGVFLTVYFTFRFLVEFFKEFQTEQLRTEGPLGGIEQAIGYHFTMGQWLSVIPVLLGIVIIIRALRQPKDAFPVPVPTVETELKPATAKPGKRR